MQCKELINESSFSTIIREEVRPQKTVNLELPLEQFTLYSSNAAVNVCMADSLIIRDSTSLMSSTVYFGHKQMYPRKVSSVAKNKCVAGTA